MEAESLALRRRLALADDEERRQVAQELYDGAGQQLAALSLGLKTLADLAPPGSEMDQRAAQLRVLVQATARIVHALGVRLRSQALNEFGLAAAVEAYATGWSRDTGIPLELHVRIGTARLSGEIEMAAYRMVQEALINVAKHSSAAAASLVVERRNNTLVAVIADDGHGFDTSALVCPEFAPGLGLPAMRDRAALLGGSIDVESAPGAGTTLSIHIPLDIMECRH